MSTFSIDTTKNHAIINTHHINNKTLTLRAKGLMTQLLTQPETWDGTLEGLSKLSNESEYTIKKALDELERARYIHKKGKWRKSNGQFAKANYTLRLKPTNLTDNPIHHQTHQPKYQK